jgi:hypothetical protein
MKRIVDEAARFVLAALAALALMGLGTLAASAAGCRSGTSEPSAIPEEHVGRHAYTCPMHPEIRQDGPGKCPECGMDLVPEEDAH